MMSAALHPSITHACLVAALRTSPSRKARRRGSVCAALHTCSGNPHVGLRMLHYATAQRPKQLEQASGAPTQHLSNGNCTLLCPPNTTKTHDSFFILQIENLSCAHVWAEAFIPQHQLPAKRGCAPSGSTQGKLAQYVQQAGAFWPREVATCRTPADNPLTK